MLFNSGVRLNPFLCGLSGIYVLLPLPPLLSFLLLSLSPIQEDRVGECLQLMTGLVGLVQHPSIPQLPLGASEVLLTLHSPENIPLWDQSDPMGAFWDISGQVRG